MTLSVFGRVKMSLSLAMRVLVVNIFIFTLFSCPNRHFSCRVFLLQESERKVLRFLTPITWAKLGMFSAVGALYGTLLPSRLQTFQCCWCAVHSRSLEGHSSWYDFCIGTMVTTTHISSQILPSVGRLRSTFFRHTVGTTHSEILSEAGHRRPKRLFRFLYQRLAGAEPHHWETYLENRVHCKGWDGPTLRRTLRHLPRSVPQPHRWFLLKVHLNAPITSARLVAAHVVEEPVQLLFLFQLL